MPVPSNAVLAEKIDSIKVLMEVKFEENAKEHKEIIMHQKTTNGQVMKNTKFRWQAAVYGVIGIIIIPLLIKELFEKVF